MQEKVVVITGGYGKLGTAFAAEFRSAGWETLITGRDEEKLKTAAKELKHHYFKQDVAQEKDAIDVRDFIAEHFGKVDCLINNAAIFRSGSIENLKPQDLLDSLRINLYGPYLTTHTMLPLLKKSDSPLVINVSSTSGHRADPGSSAYNASKFGLMGLPESLRKDLRKLNIRLTTISPSSIKFHDEEMDGGKGVRLNGKDVAEAALFLANSRGRALFRDLEIWATNP